jgi:hypothetical protein
MEVVSRYALYGTTCILVEISQALIQKLSRAFHRISIERLSLNTRLKASGRLSLMRTYVGDETGPYFMSRTRSTTGGGYILVSKKD